MGPRLTIKLIRWESEKRPNDRKDSKSVNVSRIHITEDGQFTRCGKNVRAARSDTMPYIVSGEVGFDGVIPLIDSIKPNVCRSCLRITGLKV